MDTLNVKSGLDRYGHSIRNWWLLAVLGIAIFIVGILVLMNPGQSFLAISVVFAAMVIATGIIQLYLAYYTPAHGGRGWLIAGGVIELFLGILLLSKPVALATVVPLILGFWILFRSVSLIGTAGDMMAMKMRGPGWIIVLAILLMICAFIIIAYPAVGAGAIVIWIGISFMLAGIAMCALGFYLMSLRKKL